MYFYGRNRSDVVGTDEDCTGIRDGGEAFRENASGNKVFVPRLPLESDACKYISLNFLSNILGLGWAATPAGLKAMECLADLEDERIRSRVASKEMCTFLIINISSLQLIPVNMIAYRAQYGSINPAAVVGPGIVATAVSTATAVIFCRIMNRRGRGR